MDAIAAPIGINSTEKGHLAGADLVGVAQTTGSNGDRAVAVSYEPALKRDIWIYRMVVGILGIVIVVAAVGGVLIGMAGRSDVPEVVLALGTGAVGALGGLLAPSPSGRQ